MITNFDTNKVFFAKGLSHCIQGSTSLIEHLHHERMNWAELPFTNAIEHIWARDYMPIQVSERKYVKFRYDPDYLKDAPEYKPDTAAILESINIQVVNSDINMDGGNIISCGDKVIMTDKVFAENPQYSEKELLDSLTTLLEAKPVIIPWDRYEEYGHADGMVRYMGDGRVLLNNYCDFDKPLRQRLIDALKPHFIVEELHYGAYTDKSWAFLNFLHVDKRIFLPMIDCDIMDSAPAEIMLTEKLQKKALKQIREAYPQCDCIPINNYGQIIKLGGALNCTTWNIMTDEEPIDKRVDLSTKWNQTRAIEIKDKMNETFCRVQKEAADFLQNNYLKVGDVCICPKEIEVYYNDGETFADNSVHCNELQQENENHFYIHRKGRGKKDAYKGGHYPGIDFVVSNTPKVYHSYLLRSVKMGTEVIVGPHKVLEAIKEITRLSYKELECTIIEVCRRTEIAGKVLCSERINLGKSVDVRYKEARLRLVISDDDYRTSDYPLKERMVVEYLQDMVSRGRMKGEDAGQFAKEHLGYMPGSIKEMVQR